MGALYARVSSEKQERNETIASQLDALQRRAIDGGYDVLPAHVFIDAHHSGARLDRPAVDRLRDLAAEGAFEAVLVYSPDRLARQYAHHVLLMEELAQSGCRVILLNHALGDSPAQQMLLPMQGVFAAYERALSGERLRRGRVFAARQGRVNWSNPPYGYAYRAKTETAPQQLIINEAEAEVVRQMYQWLIEEGLSSYASEHRLATQGVPTRTGRATGWQQRSVSGILRNSRYKGEASDNQTMAVDTRRPSKGRGCKD